MGSSQRLYQPAPWRFTTCAQSIFPSWRSGCGDNDCTVLARAVVAIDAHLQRGHKVVVQCDHGQRRTSMAIYVVMRWDLDTYGLPMIKTMRPAMYRRLARASKCKDLYAKAQCVLNYRGFSRVYRRELAEFCIGLQPCM